MGQVGIQGQQVPVYQYLQKDVDMKVGDSMPGDTGELCLQEVGTLFKEVTAVEPAVDTVMDDHAGHGGQRGRSKPGTVQLHEVLLADPDSPAKEAYDIRQSQSCGKEIVGLFLPVQMKVA